MSKQRNVSRNEFTCWFVAHSTLHRNNKVLLKYSTYYASIRVATRISKPSFSKYGRSVLNGTSSFASLRTKNCSNEFDTTPEVFLPSDSSRLLHPHRTWHQRFRKCRLQRPDEEYKMRKQPLYNTHHHGDCTPNGHWSRLEQSNNALERHGRTNHRRPEVLFETNIRTSKRKKKGKQVQRTTRQQGRKLEKQR